ncbi:MAG: lipoate--protein ligase family protein [Candidatus Omnitrophica bacterium]|nr:lipoate--protein ligase family protein [Candidatus Omnitrophota bacterium]MDD5487786.1 lipoate--protein ligase family protein [Candidatus Omnitrophota bacterium]
MDLIDIPFTTPEEMMAADEVLLSLAESGDMSETLRFWKPDRTFVVLGRSCSVPIDCHVENCANDGVALVRRVSGGGSVLQGTGCLNYSLVLSYGRDKRYAGIRSSYEAILGDLCEAFSGKGIGAEISPISDISYNGKKVSGNAQARKKRYFLHHGTVLFGMDIGLVGKYLKHPPREPGYRKGRAHDNFMSNLPLPAEDIVDLIMDAFDAKKIPILPGKNVMDKVEKLARDKFASDEWTYCS